MQSKQAKYNKEKTKLITIRLIKTTDKDILERLDEVGNKQGYIKSLIRRDIEGGGDNNGNLERR